MNFKKIQGKMPTVIGAGIGLAAYMKGMSQLTESNDMVAENATLVNALVGIGAAYAAATTKNQWLQGVAGGVAAGAVVSVLNRYMPEPLALPEAGNIPRLGAGKVYEDPFGTYAAAGSIPVMQSEGEFQSMNF